jgi:uncharacterized membrane protein HdeD (DUF308 family)
MANTGMMTMRRLEDVGRHSGWFIALGIAFIVGGFLALLMPLVASVAVALLVGWVFILVGIVQLVHAWQIRDWGGAIWQTIIGLVILVGGIAMVIDPIVAALTLTILVGVVFLVKGVAQIVLATNLRPRGGWQWVLAAGILSVLVGLMILLAWPLSGAWVLGTLAGLSFILTGWSYVMMAMAARRVATV